MKESKKGMSKSLIFIMAAVILAVVVIAVFGFSGKINSNAVSNTANTVPNSENGKTKLSDSQYASYTYLISLDTLTSDAQNALTGFNLKKTVNSDGTTTIDLVATNPEYQTQSYTLHSGESLYFIERSLGDDSGNTDNSIGDDMALVVDSNGYITQGPGPA